MLTNSGSKVVINCEHITQRKIEISILLILNALNPIQDGHFRGCLRMGGSQKAPLPSLKSVIQILQ